jgi:hypothetical protein
MLGILGGGGILKAQYTDHNAKEGLSSIAGFLKHMNIIGR